MNKIVVFALLAAAIGCQPGAAETVHETCMILAFQDFNKANLALLREVPVMSVESALAQRRLEEQYCLRIVRCMLGDSTDQTTIRFKATFLSCLREESLQNMKQKVKTMIKPYASRHREFCTLLCRARLGDWRAFCESAGCTK